MESLGRRLKLLEKRGGGERGVVYVGFAQEQHCTSKKKARKIKHLSLQVALGRLLLGLQGASSALQFRFSVPPNPEPQWSRTANKPNLQPCRVFRSCPGSRRKILPHSKSNGPETQEKPMNEKLALLKGVEKGTREEGPTLGPSSPKP